MRIYGEQARVLANELGLELDGTHTARNNRIHFTYRSVEGHQKIDVGFESKETV